MEARGPAYPPPRHRAAVVQIEAVHEECLPALAHLLRLSGVEPTILLNDHIKTLRPGLRLDIPTVNSASRSTPLDGSSSKMIDKRQADQPAELRCRKKD